MFHGSTEHIAVVSASYVSTFICGRPYSVVDRATPCSKKSFQLANSAGDSLGNGCGSAIELETFGVEILTAMPPVVASYLMTVVTRSPGETCTALPALA